MKIELAIPRKTDQSELLILEVSISDTIFKEKRKELNSYKTAAPVVKKLLSEALKEWSVTDEAKQENVDGMTVFGFHECWTTYYNKHKQLRSIIKKHGFDRVRMMHFTDEDSHNWSLEDKLLEGNSITIAKGKTNCQNGKDDVDDLANKLQF